MKACLEELPLPLDNRRTGAEVKGKDENLDLDVDVEVDDEKTRKWKFRFLDLMIEMLLDERGMSGEEVGNVLLYAEVATQGFRKKLEGKRKGKVVEYHG
jgi:hypothetical protein